MNSEHTLKRIKLNYNNLKYSLGKIPLSIEELYNIIKSTINFSGAITLSYRDQENDKIILTTYESFQEILQRISVFELDITVKNILNQNILLKDEVFELRKCIETLKGVFSIVIGSRIVGSGIVTNCRLALTASKVLPTPEIAKTAYALFENSGFQFDFNPEIA